MRPTVSYLGLAAIPFGAASLWFLAASLLRNVAAIYPLLIFLAVGALFAFVVAGPVYLILLAKYYAIRRGVSYAFCAALSVVFGIGGILVVNAGYALFKSKRRTVPLRWLGDGGAL